MDNTSATNDASKPGVVQPMQHGQRYLSSRMRYFIISLGGTTLAAMVFYLLNKLGY